MEIKFDCVSIVTTIADSPWLVTACIDNLRQIIASHEEKEPIVGIDVKLNPGATSNLHNKPAAILQLCYGTHCIIIQLLHLSMIPQSLKTFLADRSILFAGVVNSDYLSKIKFSYGLANWMARDVARYTSADLVENVRLTIMLNIERPTSVSSSDWGARNLTMEQIKYATIDAYASRLLGVKFFA